MPTDPSPRRTGRLSADELAKIAALYPDEEHPAASTPAPNEPPVGETLPAGLHRGVASFALVTLPLVFINAPLPGQPSLMQCGMLAAAIALPLALIGRPRPSAIGKNPVAWFVALNLAYLGYMAWRSDRFGDETDPTWFFAKMIVLLGALSAAAAVDRIAAISRTDAARHVTTVSTIGIAGFSAATAVAIYRSDLTPGEIFGHWSRRDAWGYMRSMQIALGSYTTDDPVFAMRRLPVYRNSVAEAIAALSLLTLLLSWGRSWPARSVATVGGILVLASLSRSSTLLFVTGVTGFLPLAIRRWSVWRTFAGLIVITAAVLAVTFWIRGGDDPISERFGVNVVEGPRLPQYVQALTADRTGEQLIFGSGANRDVAGHRIHNLLLSSYYEGGLIALSLIIAQFVVLARVALSLLDRGAAGFAMTGVLAAGVLRTMVAGGGGYYTPNGLVLVLTVLLLSRQRPAESTR